MKKSILLGLIIAWVLHFNAKAQVAIIPSSQWEAWTGTSTPTWPQMNTLSGWSAAAVNNGLVGSWEPFWHPGEFGLTGPMAATDYVWTNTDPQFEEAWVITTFDAGVIGNCEQFLWESFADNCHTVYLNGTEVGSTTCDPANNSVTTKLSIDLTPNVQPYLNYIAVKITNFGASTSTTNPRYLIGGLDIVNPNLSLDMSFNFLCPHTELIGTKNDSQSPVKFESYQWYFEGRPIIGATNLTHNAMEGDGNYTLRGYYGNGCYKERTRNVGHSDLRFLNDVHLSLICGETLTLEESTGLPMESYLWNTGEATSSIVVDHGGTYTIRTTNADGCMTEQKFVVTDDCCEAEVNTSNGTEIIYDKKLFNTLYPDLKTISSVVDNGTLYLLMQDDVAGPFASGGSSTFGFVLCMLDEETGTFLQAYDYQLSVFGTANLYDQNADMPNFLRVLEIEIISDGTSQENGIYIIGNSKQVPEGYQAIRERRQSIQTDSGVSIKLDLNDKALIDIKYTSIPKALIGPEDLNGFNYESFSRIDEEDNKGWLIVGSAFTHEIGTGHQYQWPILFKTDLLGNILDHKMVEFDLPCPSCPGDNESVWAIDISEPITGNDAEYAVLLQSKAATGFRTSYLLVDKDLNIYTRGKPIQWWKTNSSQYDGYPSKIMYENFGADQSIKIVGSYSNQYETKGFIHDFGANSTTNYIYNSATSKDFDISTLSGGIKDFTKQGTSYYLASQLQIIKLNQSLDVVSGSKKWSDQLAGSDAPHPYTFYPNLIHPCQDRGVVFMSRDFGYCRKASSDLQMKCGYEPSPISTSPSLIGFVESNHTERLTEFEVAIPEHSRLNVSFDTECCDGNSPYTPPSRCQVFVDFDYAVDCDRVTITDVDVIGDMDPGALFYWYTPTIWFYNGSFTIENRPVIYKEGSNQLEICLNVVYTKDGSSCTETVCKTVDFLPRSISGQSHENGWGNVYTNSGNDMLGPWTISSGDEYYPIDIDGDGQEELLCTKRSIFGSGTASVLKYNNSGGVWTDVGTSFSTAFRKYINDGEFIIGDFDTGTPGQEIICMGLDFFGVIIPGPTMFSINSNGVTQIWQETGTPITPLSPYFRKCYGGNFDPLTSGDELLGFDAFATKLLRYNGTAWVNFFSSTSNPIWVDRDDIMIGDFSGFGTDQALTTSANPTLYFYNSLATPPDIEVAWSSALSQDPGKIRSWSMPIANNDFMLIGDIDNPDSKEEILFIDGGSGASKASTAELFLSYSPNYAYWIDNWANMVNEPFIDDWPFYDISEDYTKYLLIRNGTTIGKDDLLAIRKVTCDGAMYVANMYRTNSTTYSYKKSQDETTSIDNPVEDETKFWIYPNPTNGSFAIGSSVDGQLIDYVKIISMTGQVILDDRNVNASRVYSLEGHESGIYIVEVSTDDNMKRMKLILNH